MVAAAGTRPLLALSGGLPPAEAFPYEDLRAAADRLLARAGQDVLQYSPTEGHPRLRALVTRDLRERQKIAVAGAGVVITTGSQQGLDLVAKLLLDPGDVAVVERPAYVGALRALAAYQPTVVGIPVDGEGMDTRHLAALLADGLRPKLCYVVPNFSNPSGATMPADRRHHLTELAARHGFVIVEDDPYGDLRFHGEPVEPVAALGGAVAAVGGGVAAVGGAADVVYLGSFSKVMAPALRVGYAAAPPWLTRPIVLAKQATDLTSSAFTQLLVAELLQTEGWLDAHVGRLRALYAERCDALLASIERRLGGRLRPNAPAGGMFVWATIEVPGVDAAALTAACLRRDVAIVPGTEFTLDGGCEREVRLSFSVLTPPELDEAVARIALAFADLGQSGVGAASAGASSAGAASPGIAAPGAV
jgi:DNA-binding transcriptional MocR family regulator